MNRADRRRWRAAATFADIAELTAQWLEGRIGETPTYGGPPDPETEPLRPLLAAVNRAGFLTDCSQPGGTWPGWQQRAAVEGFTCGSRARLISDRATAYGLEVTIHQAAGRPGACESCPLVTGKASPPCRGCTVVTLDDGDPYTSFGCARPASELAWDFRICRESAVRETQAMHPVTLIDPVWGRAASPLWLVLEQFAASTVKAEVSTS